MNEKQFSVTFTQDDLDVLQEALIGLRQQKESEAEDAKMLLAWIYKTKVEVVGRAITKPVPSVGLTWTLVKPVTVWLFTRDTQETPMFQ